MSTQFMNYFHISSKVMTCIYKNPSDSGDVILKASCRGVVPFPSPPNLALSPVSYH